MEVKENKEADRAAKEAIYMRPQQDYPIQTTT